jgi:hypothetical protein
MWSLLPAGQRVDTVQVLVADQYIQCNAAQLAPASKEVLLLLLRQLRLRYFFLPVTPPRQLPGCVLV